MESSPYVDVLPWVLFALIDRRHGLGLGWASSCATLCAVGLAAWGIWRGRRAPLAWLAVATFAVPLTVWLAIGGAAEQFGAARTMVALVLAIVLLVSCLRTPVLEAYTGARVSPAEATRPRFRRLNREITVMWGFGALLIAGSLGLADLDPTPVMGTFFNWVVPLAIGAVALRTGTLRWMAYQLETQLEAEPAARDDRSTLALVLGDGAPTSGATIVELPLRRRSVRQ